MVRGSRRARGNRRALFARRAGAQVRAKAPLTDAERHRGRLSGRGRADGVGAFSFADDIESSVADVLLYTAAVGTAWSRINDNRHWLTDTALGAVIGITTSKIVSGRWRIFNFRPPSFLVGPNGKPAVGMTITF
jgi:hypothetical protein